MTDFEAEHSHRRARALHVENYGVAGEPDELVFETVGYRFAGVKSTFDGARLRWTGQGSGLTEVTLELLLRDGSDRCVLEVSLTKHLFSFLSNNYWLSNTPPAQQGPLRLRYRFSLAGDFEPSSATRFGRVARTDAQMAEILPLDPFRSTDRPRFLHGQLIDVGTDEQTEVMLRQVDEQTIEPQVVNLVARARDTEVRLPDGFHLAGPAGSAVIGSTSFSLPRYGIARHLLVRPGHEDNHDESRRV